MSRLQDLDVPFLPATKRTSDQVAVDHFMETEAALQEREEAARASRIQHWKKEFAAAALLCQSAQSMHFEAALAAGPIDGVNPAYDWAPKGRCLPGLMTIQCQYSGGCTSFAHHTCLIEWASTNNANKGGISTLCR